ncbi:family with sequence similarity 21 [Aphomia sociella]
MLLGLPWRCSASKMFADSHIDGFHAIIRKKAASLLQRLRNSGNGILKMIAARPDRPIQRHWVEVDIEAITMEAAGIESLRTAAPGWSLAGDKQLLDVLHNIHETLVSRCQETNRKLSEMTATLDDAAIDLQNVNNRFMALSNSQFIESRVYDDDVDVVASTEQTKEPPKTADTTVELEKLRQSLKVLESMHEPLHILRDSDSESDTEDEDVGRLVLKPKDLYADRPLPYIIGSSAWKSKWHAGLLPDDSDTDSSVSKPDREDEQYSDSEPEITNIQTDKQDTHNDRTVSTTSSELASEQDVSPVKPSPSDVAAELARRLGGPPPRIQEEETDFVPAPTSRKVYKPEQAQTSTIFSDEPPPLDTYSDEESQEDDIFAELHKSKPYVHSDKVQSRVNQDLFGGLHEAEDDGDIFGGHKESLKPASQKPSLYTEESEPELFATPKVQKQDVSSSTESSSVKKPVGGISLFGTNKGTEIGAAILKRNRRQSSTDEETGSEEITPNRQEERKTKEKDIFDDLFAKSEKEQRKIEKKNVKIEKDAVKVENKQKEVKKVDLFSDNLFDDIDDIFTTNITKVPVKEPNKNQKSIFDDDDDLFSEIPVTKHNKQEIKSSSRNRTSIFDSEDDIFSEKSDNKTVIDKFKDGANNVSGDKVEINAKQNKLFDDDSDSDIFNKRNENPPSLPIIDNKDQSKNITVKSKTSKPTTSNVFAKETNLVINDNPKSSSSLFDDDDDDDLFKTSTSIKTQTDQYRKTDNLDKANTNVRNNIIREENSNKQDKSRKDNVNSNIVKNDELQKNTVFDNGSGDDLFLITTPGGSASVNTKDEYSYETKKTEANSHYLNEENDDLSSNFKNKNGNISNILSTESKELSGELKDNVKRFSKNDNGIKIKSTDKTNDQSNPMEKESHIFDDEWEDDLFTKPANNSSKKILTVKSKLFDDVSDDNIFDTERSSQADSRHVQEKIDSKSQSILDKESNNDLFEETDANVYIINNKDIEPTITKTGKFHDKNLIQEISQSNPNMLENENEEIITKSQIFDDDLQDDLFRTRTGNDNQNKEKAIERNENKDFEDKVIPVETEQEKLTQIVDNSAINVFPETNEASVVDGPNFIDNIIEKEALFNPPQIPVYDKPDAFSDIFSEPPEFEKPKEPKKSKNVNALFDDDSDDEALFFKKSDPSLDEMPDIPSPVGDSRLFGIFHDEPPAIDVDFVHNTNKKEGNNLFDEFDDDDNDLFVKKSVPIDSKTKPESVNLSATSPDILKESKLDTPSETTKPVGKLRTMNFNIDVSALLPGASPKKVKPVEQTDGQNITKKSEENVHVKETKVEEINPKLVKSVSFEGDPDSNVLDNKLSKERAKIQVKRRPSTRRARKEAVRKSAIDFGDNESTDNSSSIDDPPKTFNVEASVKQEMDNKTIKTVDTTDNAKIDDVDSTTDIETKVTKDVKSKVVYVLHDEDIFTNIDTNQTLQKNKVLNIVDDDHLFKSEKEGANPLDKSYKENELSNIPNINKSNDSKIDNFTDNATINNPNIDNTKNIEVETIDNAKTSHIETITSKETIDSNFNNQNKHTEKQNVVNTKAKKSIFDDLSDDDNELFGNNKSKVKDMFDSDSDGELFGKRDVKEKKRVDVKKSLFSDEDDDDLFGAKTKSVPDIQHRPARQTAREVSKSAEPVFEDPLSLLGGEDE